MIMKKTFMLLLATLLLAFNLYAQWREVPVPDGGNALCLQEEGGIAYALAYGGMYQSMDEGVTWTWMAPRYGGMNKFIIAKGIFYGQSLNSSELYKSTDGAKTWQMVFDAGNTELIRDFWSDGNKVLVLGSLKIHHSSDQGETWTPSAHDILGDELENLCATPTECFAWGASKILRSSDGGLNWEEVFSSVEAFLSVGTVGQKIFVLYHQVKRIVISTDGLRNWKTIDSDKMWSGDYYGQFARCTIKGKGDFIALFFPMAYPTYSRLSYSLDGGLNWNVIYTNGSPVLPLKVTDLLVFKEHFLLNGLELYRADHAMKNIESSCTGLKGHYIKHLAIKDDQLFVNSLYHVLSTEDNGKNWKNLTPKAAWNTSYYYVNVQVNKNLILINQTDSSYKYSSDHGKTWKIHIEGSQNTIKLTENYAWLYKEDLGRLYRLDHDFKIEKTFDVKNWFPNYRIDTPTPQGQYLNFTLYDNTGSEIGHLVLNEQLEAVINAPSSPCLFSPSRLIPNAFMGGDELLDICNQTAYYFQPYGKKWEKYHPINWKEGTIFLQNPVTGIAQQHGLTFLSIRQKGIFYTNDHSGRFYPLHLPSPTTEATAMTIKNNQLWLATQDARIYVFDLATYPPGENTPLSLNLYPNPSNGHMTLSSDLFLTEYSPFTLHDATGKVVAERELPPGNRWDLDFDLPQGVYFLRMLTQNGVVGKKWVLR
jgi:hypothetical protein